MHGNEFVIGPEQAGHAADIERLLDRRFGSDRRKRTAYRLRDGRQPVPQLSVAAHADDQLVGTIRFWEIMVGETGPVLLLGPLAVADQFVGRGCGIGLMEHGLTVAAGLGYEAVILVGDEPYYSKVGFQICPPERLVMPGPVEQDRLLMCELKPGAAENLSGEVHPAG